MVAERSAPEAGGPLNEPVRDLLSHFGLMGYSGPHGLIAGYRHDQVPEELVEEWKGLFREFRNRLLAPLARTRSTLIQRDPEMVQDLIRQRDRAAAAMAEREMRRRYGRGNRSPAGQNLSGAR